MYTNWSYGLRPTSDTQDLPFSFLIQLLQHKLAVATPTNYIKLVKEIFCYLKKVGCERLTVLKPVDSI